MASVRSRTVSYTHLDVYKRQVCKRKKAAIPAVSYDNSANNSSWCSTAAAHNESAKRQEQLALSLLVFRILTDNSDASFSLDDFAFQMCIRDRSYGERLRSYQHSCRSGL